MFCFQLIKIIYITNKQTKKKDTGCGKISYLFKQPKSCLETLWSSKTYPVLQLRGELGLELAHGATGVISLNEDFGSDGSLLPHVLQAVSLWKDNR